MFVINIDNGRSVGLNEPFIEQQLGAEICVQRLVLIEVIARDVGERPDLDPQTVEAMLM